MGKSTIQFVCMSFPTYVHYRKPDYAVMPVYKLTKKQAEEYAELLKSMFINHWREEVKIKKKPPKIYSV
jgi:hypothetical protein